MRNTFVALNAMQLRVRISWQLDTTEKHRPIPEALRLNTENKNRFLKIPGNARLYANTPSTKLGILPRLHVEMQWKKSCPISRQSVCPVDELYC